VLVESCYGCHSPKAEKGVKGGLALDTKDGLLKGGDTGPALVPGEPEKSLLIKAVRYHDENLQMPPKGKRLPESQVEALVAWVKMGAPDPRTGQTALADPKSLASKHWAFQPVREPSVPAVKNKKLVQTPVDAFLLARLESKGLKFSPRADSGGDGGVRGGQFPGRFCEGGGSPAGFTALR
jgi:Planctomycete cytochrome C